MQIRYTIERGTGAAWYLAASIDGRPQGHWTHNLRTLRNHVAILRGMGARRVIERERAPSMFGDLGSVSADDAIAPPMSRKRGRNDGHDKGALLVFAGELRAAELTLRNRYRVLGLGDARRDEAANDLRDIANELEAISERMP